jgi:hypothetical protein
MSKFIKYSKVNENYFRTITPKSAYILGFICADGNIIKTKRNGGILSIGLKYSDKYILEYITKEISNGQVPVYKKIIKNKPYVFLNICRRKIVDDIIKLGIKERKSLTLKKVKIPKKMLSYFIRGFFDGDGYIRVIKNHDKRGKGYNYESLEVTLTATKSFLLQIKSYLQYKFPYMKVRIKCCMPYYNAHVLSLSTFSARIFLLWIYTNLNNSFFLQRKFKIFKDFYFKNKYRNFKETRRNRYADLLTICGFYKNS